MFDRTKVAMILAEFLGAGILSSVVLSMIVRTSFPFFAALGAGLTAGLLVLALDKVSGAHANPAVTLGMWTQKLIQTPQAIVYIAVQLLGGVAAWRLSEYLLSNKLVSMAPKSFDWHVFVAEAVGALIFGLGLGAVVSKKLEGSQKAMLVGGTLALGILVASLGGNGILNPAVAVAIRSWDWAYALGPVAGVVVGMNLYLIGMVPAPVASSVRSAAKVSSKSTSSKSKKRK